MSNALTHKLAEQWRDALSAYVIHHVLPDQSQAASLNMLTAEHLDRYFMMDTQVTSAVTTSYLAQALATTQTYINSILGNLEPGYDQDFDPALIAFWQQAMSNYSLWAAYQMLEDYPENYIRAEMRLDKTEPFKTLENDLGQGKINDANVQNALLTYLKHYEYQNSIRVQSGYIDYQDRHTDGDHFDGYAFANSDYYLLGNPAWTVTGTDVSGTFGLQLHMEGFTTPVKRGLWLLLSQKVEDEFDLLLEGSPATEVGYFWRGQPQRVTLKPKDTSPLSAGTALKSRLQFRDAQSLPVSKLVANPDYGVPRPIPVGGNEWTLTGASDTSGRFGLEVWVEDFDTPRVLSTAVLMSSHLDDEVDYTLSGSDISEPPIFRRNVGRTISLKPKAGSPLTQLDLVARLSFNDGGTLKQTDMNAVPGYGQPTTVAKGLNWTLTGTDVSGP